MQCNTFVAVVKTADKVLKRGSSRKTTKPNICTVKPDQLPHVYYIPADIISIKGKEFMNAYKLREDGRSIRLYLSLIHI